MPHCRVTEFTPGSHLQRRALNDTAMDHTAETCCRTDINHSSDIREIHDLTDLDKCRINNENDCPYECERRQSAAPGDRRCESHKKGDVHGNKSIVRRVESDVYSDIRRADDLKFKCRRDGWYTRERTVANRVCGALVVGLLLAALTSCSAAPSRPRSPRSAHHEKNARSYLETFGYLQKGRPEVGNLLMGDQIQNYEDDYRIAIKTLQEFGGIAVTGELDDETIHLMKQKRCGRPDREEGDEENGHRRKRFAIQGSKWEHTNLTWSLSQDRRPSQLDPHGTRSVLKRALDVWEQASRLTFTEINSDKADIVVSFAKKYHDDSYPFDGRGTILAHAFFPGSGRGGDAHFDDDELWLLKPKNDDEEGTSLFAVAAHEFGHSLGLSHSSVRGALMFPWYQGIQPNFVLPEDDKNGIQQMYGPKETTKKWARIPYYRPAETPPPTTTTTTTTTTRRPSYRHNHKHNEPHRPSHTPNSRDRERERNPVYYPERPYYPNNPDRYYPTRRHFNASEEYPRRVHPNHRPIETTTSAPTYRPRVRYPDRSDYPYNRPVYPTESRPSYPRQPYYPRTTPRPAPTTTAAPNIPDACDTSYDAVALLRNELFIFKGKYHWRIGAQGRYKGYPMEIRWMWSGLPHDLTHVDAVYERPDGNIAIFIGKQLYLFNSKELLPGYPKPLSHLGLPHSLEKLDAAMVWGHNSKTYFYSGSMYWKFDEDEGRVELDYPRNMVMWQGVGYNIDSVFQWKDGKTYFFKGKGFWKFNDLQMRVEHEKQLPSAQFWMGCPTERPGTRSPYRALPAPGSTLRSFSSSASTTLLSSTILLITSTILVLARFTH